MTVTPEDLRNATLRCNAAGAENAAASAARKALILLALEEGMTHRDTATHSQLSRGRISQITKG